MKKINLQIVATIILFSVVLFSCKKEMGSRSCEPQTAISSKVKSDFEKAKQNWNQYAGSLVSLESFAVTGSIKNDADKQAMIATIMDDKAMAAYGNILDETSMHLNTVGELQNENAATKTTMRTYLEQQVNAGDVVVDITWKSNSRSFTSKCIVRKDIIMWDNLLTSTIMMDKKPVVTIVPSTEMGNGDPTDTRNSKTQASYRAWYKSSNTWTGNWIWGGHRGDMGEEITIYCYSNGNVYNTDNRDWANMTLGSAKSESRILVNTGTYGKIQYALGISTPFASVSFNNANWKVEVSGIGSSMVSNGSHTLVPYLL